MSGKKRNGYIDMIKFLLSCIIVLFHLNNGMMKGGRVAVEGFFMITGYLMMCSLSRENESEYSLGKASVRFIAHKYSLIFPCLLVSSMIGLAVIAVIEHSTVTIILKRLVLMFFEVFPISMAGFSGYSTTGISWYISAMMLGLAILYPLCRKNKSSFTLIWCPLISIFCYGLLDHSYGHLAVNRWMKENTLVSPGMLRGLAGLAAGVVVYEVVNILSAKKITRFGFIAFSTLEVLGFCFCYWAIQHVPKSKYDYIVLFVIFGLLCIGLSKKTLLGRISGNRFTKALGTASTFIVLNHYYWNTFLTDMYGAEYKFTSKVWLYFALIFVTCVVAWGISKLIERLIHKLSVSVFDNT